MTPARFLTLLRELVDENPFAIRPFLKVVAVVFTEQVPTLAVSCGTAPELRVNLPFVTAHCQGDAEVKAVILHEFLHILLRHTEERDPASPAEHIATDAVINAIIHRQEGPAASGMMSRYYGASEGLLRLLRPPAPGELPPDASKWGSFHRAWDGLYRGSLVVDDIRDLAHQLQSRPKSCLGTLSGGARPLLLGNHEDPPGPGRTLLAQILDEALRMMNGSGIWRAPHSRGVGADPCDTLVRGQDPGLRAWERRTLEVLKKHLLPDPRRGVLLPAEQEARLPVLSPKDRRAFIRAAWSPFFPEAAWTVGHPKPAGRAQVYLDVSGSMAAEMPLVIALLNRLRRVIRMPFWAFSDRVAPATIKDGALVTQTTGGTSMACVLAHVARTRPRCAVVVTDGYIESLPAGALDRLQGIRLHALVTRDGSAHALRAAGIPYTQLPSLPPSAQVRR